MGFPLLIKKCEISDVRSYSIKLSSTSVQYYYDSKIGKKGIKKRQKGRLGRCSGWVRETRAQNSLSVPPGRAHLDLGQYQRQIHLIITFADRAAQNLIKSIQLTGRFI